jgi:mRNA interferase MazF
MRKGAIVLIPFPFTDLSGQKIRPAVILNDLSGSEDCIVAFISSIPDKSKQKYNLPVKVSKINGLKTNSVIKVSKIATLQKKSVIGEIGILEKSYQVNLFKILKTLFN